MIAKVTITSENFKTAFPVSACYRFSTGMCRQLKSFKLSFIALDGLVVLCGEFRTRFYYESRCNKR